MKITNMSFRCYDCDKSISSMAEAINHVDDSVTPTKSNIMGDFDIAVKTLQDHPEQYLKILVFKNIYLLKLGSRWI